MILFLSRVLSSALALLSSRALLHGVLAGSPSPLRGKATGEGALLAKGEVDGFTKEGDGICKGKNGNNYSFVPLGDAISTAKCASRCSQQFDDSVLVGIMVRYMVSNGLYCLCLKGGEKIAGFIEDANFECYSNDKFGTATGEGALLAKGEVDGFTKEGNGFCKVGALYATFTSYTLRDVAECASWCLQDLDDTNLTGFVFMSNQDEKTCFCLEGGEKIAGVRDMQDGNDYECYSYDKFKPWRARSSVGSGGGTDGGGSTAAASSAYPHGHGNPGLSVEMK